MRDESCPGSSPADIDDEAGRVRHTGRAMSEEIPTAAVVESVAYAYGRVERCSDAV
jgi:hypothetical protein